MELLTRERAWPRGDRLRRAGVSAFGISGTNAHVILEEAPLADIGEPEEPLTAPDTDRPPHALPWILSAKSVPALGEQAERLLSALEENSEVSAQEVGFSLATTRSKLEHRAVIVGVERDDLMVGLRALAKGEIRSGVVRGSSGDSQVAWVFPGQGSQWVGMGVELLQRSRAFAERIAACERALEPYTDWSLRAVLRSEPDAPELDRVDVAQPVLWAVMVSLAQLWQSSGVQPSAVVGHSQGEIAAACVAGGLSLEDGAKVVALRSQAIGRVLSGHGGMVSVALSREEVLTHLTRWDDRLSVAAVNGPGSVVVSGEPQALDELLVLCERENIRARRVPVDYASHSAQVEKVREEVLRALDGITPRSGTIPFRSTVTGDWLDTAELDAAYWYTNLRNTVEFEGAVSALLHQGYGVFIEVSPHPVLTVAVGDLVEEANGVVVGSLRRNDGGMDRMLLSLAEAFVRGVDIDWAGFFSGVRWVGLPTYAFQRERFWLESSGAAVNAEGLGVSAAGHPLLGAAVSLAGDGGALLTARLSLDTHPWLADHSVLGTALLPGTALVELAVRAGDEVGCDV
ncbi:acyltransferase domain-containing protein, partial [Streptomyces tsukubensis]|uniref:acyltransferase domain-containing protein n=1 Tax=Streptomyces tsukubensis TaxID=83656 RepID=UPI002117549C